MPRLTFEPVACDVHPGSNEHIIFEQDDHHLPAHQESVYGFQDLEDDIRDYCVYSEQIDIEFDQEELPVSEEEVHENHPYQRNRIKDLTDRERQDIYEALLEKRLISRTVTTNWCPRTLVWSRRPL